MDRFVRRLAVVVASCALAVPGAALATAKTITILHVNDTHSHLDAVGPKDENLDGTRGGLAKAASVVASLKAQHPDALFLHAGDFFQGDSYFPATFGTVELSVLRDLGLDAIAVGNHELVFGPALLAQVVLGTPGGAPSFLSANLDVSPAGLPPFVAPSLTKVVNENTPDAVKVGIFGLTLPRDAIERPEPAVLVSDREAIRDLAQRQIDDLRAGGATVVVCLSHLGIDGDRALARTVTGLDAIVGGHDHLAFAKPVFDGPTGAKAIPIVQAGEFYENVGVLTLALAEDGTVTGADGVLVPVGAGVPRAPPVAAAVAFSQGLVNELFGAFDAIGPGEDLFHTPVAVAARTMTRFFDPRFKDRDTALGNLTADALRDAAGPDADVGITVGGFVEDEIAAGVVVGEDLFRPVCDGSNVGTDGAPLPLAPFPGIGFPVVTFDLTGGELVAMIETALAAGGDFFPQVSGMRFVFDSTRPLGRRVKSVEIGGAPLEASRVYRVATNLGVWLGLPAVRLPQPPVRLVGKYEYVAMRDWARKVVVLDYRSEGRSRDVAPARRR